MNNNKKYNIKNKINDFKNYFRAKKSILQNKSYNDKKENKSNFKHSFYYFSDLLKYYTYKIILRKNTDKPKNNNNIMISILSSFFFALLISIVLFFILKISVSEKQSYGDYNISKVDEYSNNQNKNNSEKTEEKTTEVERVSENAIDEEISAQSSYKYFTYTFNVDRTISTKEKVHIFNTANWHDFSSIVPEGTKLNVNFMTSPGGYMMYQIKDGEYAGKFITANNKLIHIDKNDNTNTEFISKPIAIKILDTTNSYIEKDLKTIKALVYQNVILNINGLGISDTNRLVYFISDGSFIPVDNSKSVETSRPQIIKEDTNKKNNNVDSTNKNNQSNKNNQNNKNNQSNKNNKNNQNNTRR